MNKDEQDFRDMCASMAMMGDWASQTPDWVIENTDEHLKQSAEKYFRMAEAMVKARRAQTE